MCRFCPLGFSTLLILKCSKSCMFGFSCSLGRETVIKTVKRIHNTMYIFKTETWGYAFKEKNWCLTSLDAFRNTLMKSYTPLPTWALRGYMHTLCATCVCCIIIYIFTYMVSTYRTRQVSSWSHCQIKWFTSFRFPRLQLNPWHCRCPLTKVCFQQSHVHLFVLQV